MLSEFESDTQKWNCCDFADPASIKWGKAAHFWVVQSLWTEKQFVGVDGTIEAVVESLRGFCSKPEPILTMTFHLCVEAR